MRLADFTAASQVIAFRTEREAIALTAQALEFDFDRGRIRRQRLAALVDPNAILRRNAGLVDGELERKIAVS